MEAFISRWLIKGGVLIRWRRLFEARRVLDEIRQCYLFSFFFLILVLGNNFSQNSRKLKHQNKVKKGVHTTYIHIYIYSPTTFYPQHSPKKNLFLNRSIISFSQLVISHQLGVIYFDLSFRSSHSEMFIGKGVLKICSKFTAEHPCRSAISITLQSNFIEITLRHGCSPVNLLHVFSL